MDKPVIIIGAGPAGLTAAYELAKRKTHSLIIEKDDVVGGIARTVEHNGYRFDIGGHRFFTKVERVMNMWREVLGNDFLKRPRMSHIYYKRKFFNYPIKPLDVVKKLGPQEVVLAGISYLKSKLVKRPQEISFEDYIVNNFGKRLYQTFFKSYTEKVWGIPCTEIRAEWAAQRIKGLSLTSLAHSAVFGNQGNKIKTLIEEFHYPRKGPGMMWQKTKELIESSGFSNILFSTRPVAIMHDGVKITNVEIQNTRGEKKKLEVHSLVSSMPIGELLKLLKPALDKKFLDAAQSFHYRDFIAIALIIDRKDMFSDNWIYIHEPSVQVGRIQNFKNWSPEMVADPGKTCLGLEYFCFTTDPIWGMSDKDLIAMGAKELEKIGLAKKEEVLDGVVVRMEKTYPMYDAAYEKAMPVIREAVSQFSNLYPVGRNGMHKYNNQDHAMLTAMLSVENMFGAKHNIWEVNTERTYHEEKEEAREI